MVCQTENAAESHLRIRIARFTLLATVAMAGCANSMAQTSDTSVLERQIQDLQTELQQTRGDLNRAEQKIDLLTKQIEALRRELKPSSGPPQPSAAYPSAADTAAPNTPEAQQQASSTEELAENQKVLAARVEEQHQTKVESSSKYRVKLSGLVLMNAYSNRGTVDVPDLPNKAFAGGGGSTSATLRQTVLGLQVFGPQLAGANTNANISVDFFGGVPRQPYGSTYGILRLRQAAAHMDWQNNSLTIGQDALFISPLSPTSYATLAEPALSWSGNLWVWTPQAMAEHRFHTGENSFVSVSGGLLAPLTEELPTGFQPLAGERSRRPAFGSHLAWNAKAFGQAMTFGVGGYGSHLQYDFGQQTDSWALTADWRLPLSRYFELSGEAYRGRAVGGLGGGIWQSVVFNGDPGLPTTILRPLNSIGGWTQLKFHPLPKWEFNSAFGNDNVFARDLRWAPVLRGEYMPPLARNRAAFTNVIYKPKSNWILSGEYRYIWTYGYIGPGRTAATVNLGAGVSF